MKIARWAAFAVTVVFVLLNIMTAMEPGQPGWVRIVGAVLGVAGAAAAAGLALAQTWGRAAVITVGALNMLGAVGALVSDQEGFMIGFVLGALAVLLAIPVGRDASSKVAAAR